MLSEISQSQKDKYCYDSTHMKSQKQIHINRKERGSCQGLGGQGNEEVLINGFRVCFSR